MSPGFKISCSPPLARGQLGRNADWQSALQEQRTSQIIALPTERLYFHCTLSSSSMRATARSVKPCGWRGIVGPPLTI